MEINPLQPITGINGNPVESGEITEETFLKLLTTQLQNQDPLEPASDVEFIQQMATFAQLEQQRITNSNLGILQLYQSSINNSNALNLVGREVKIQDDQIDHQAGESHRFFYPSSSEAAKVHIKVFDANGREIFSQTQTGSEDGEQEFTWQGQDDEGNTVDPGTYRIQVSLEDAEGTRFPTDVYQAKRVDGISYENGSILILVGDRKIPIENVIEVYAGGVLSGDEESGPPGFGTPGSGTPGIGAPGIGAPGIGVRGLTTAQALSQIPPYGVIPGDKPMDINATPVLQHPQFHPFRVIAGGK